MHTAAVFARVDEATLACTMHGTSMPGRLVHTGAVFYPCCVPYRLDICIVFM